MAHGSRTMASSYSTTLLPAVAAHHCTSLGQKAIGFLDNSIYTGMPVGFSLLFIVQMTHISPNWHGSGLVKNRSFRLHFFQESGHKPGTFLMALWNTVLLSAPALEEFTQYNRRDCAIIQTNFTCQQNFIVFGRCDKFEHSAEQESF